MEQQSNQQDHKIPVLQTGELVFRIRRGDAEVEHRVDLMALKLICEECEEQYSLKTVDGKLIAKSSFLIDLSYKIESLGVCGCTPTIAYQLWIAAADAMAALKNELSGMPS